jgi:hypothetical protein
MTSLGQPAQDLIGEGPVLAGVAEKDPRHHTSRRQTRAPLRLDRLFLIIHRPDPDATSILITQASCASDQAPTTF